MIWNILQIRRRMPMGDCDRYKNNYSNYLEKRLDPVTAGEIDRHLNECDECRKIIRRIGLLQKIMTDLPAQKCSENFNLQLHQKIFAEPGRGKRYGIVKKYSYAFSFMVAGFIIVFSVYSLLNKQEQVTNNQSIESYSENPVSGKASPVVDVVDYNQDAEQINIKTKTGNEFISDSSNQKQSVSKNPNIKYVEQEK
jgi:hypothetical protein